MTSVLAKVELPAAQQQPEWVNPSQVRQVRDILVGLPALVAAGDIYALRRRLATVALGAAYVVQAGDCAEDPGECTADHVRRKITLLNRLATAMHRGTGVPVVRVGRIAGQFAKPRSHPQESVGDRTLPVYRGHLVNSPDANPASRSPDPMRILAGYLAAREVLKQLGGLGQVRPSKRVWTSHEALLLDYEVPLIRQLADGRRWLASTHWPWIGHRTNQPDGAHVDLLAGVVNPVACKVGPGLGARTLVELCERLDPAREPGRLTLIARMGADAVPRLSALVHAVRSAGHPVIWLCDPMHGNTVTTPDGRKIRLLETMAREVIGFRQAVIRGGGTAGGLHLETTPDEVNECVTDASTPVARGRYTSLCDPRLRLDQALALVAAWAGSA